jgi:NCAIR mutase (PurE)-related protein
MNTARKEVTFDFGRRERIGISEAVFCAGKSVAQVDHIIELSESRKAPLLLTRLAPRAFRRLSDRHRDRIDYDAVSRTGILGPVPAPGAPAEVAVVSAGTSDAGVVLEAARTLAFHGTAADVIMDVGVAGLWRVMERRAELERYRAIIVVAGMDGALFSVIGGLVPGFVIAVPTATGYGTARRGTTALHSALTSCAPGVVAVNVGNGYGAACAALRVMRAGAAARGG